MRVLFWSELFWPYMGGAQFSALKLLLGLRQRGHKFIVVTRQDDPGLPPKAHFKGFPIYRFPFYAALADGNVDQIVLLRRQVAHLKSRFAPDVIHVNCFGLSLLFHLETRKAHPAPTLVTLRSEKYERGMLLERTLRAADWVTAPSARTVEYARQLVPNFALSASCIYNGVEMPRALSAPLPIDRPTLLCIGRLVPPKGFDLVLTALAAIIERFPRARLIIAGDGPGRRDLEQQTADLGLDDAVDFIGWVAPERVAALINTATAVVVPSRAWEAMPRVSLEAAFMARPVVAARNGGLPEVVVHGRTGLLVEKEDSTGLAEAIVFLIEHPEAAVEMGQTARYRAQKLFRLDRCVDAYDELYRKLHDQTTEVGLGQYAFEDRDASS